MRERLEWYQYTHGRDMPLHSIARMLSTILYSKRFFPYFVYNLLGGLDEQGCGAVYSYDPVGSYERVICNASGAAQGLLMPFLDNQVMFKNLNVPGGGAPPEPGHLPLASALQIALDGFTSATERHIEVGDGVEVYVVRSPTSDASVLEQRGAVEACGGQDPQTPGAVVVIRSELKKD